MTEHSPRVSVVIPTYNRDDILQRAIDSVLDQTFEGFELIVVDDASTDDTEAVVREYDDDRITYICHETNSGNGGIARNTGLEHATGDYVAFLDDDDVWLPRKLERQLECFNKSDDRVGLVYCWMNYYDGEELIERRHPTIEGNIFYHMLDKNAITAASTLMVRRSVIDAVGDFDTDLSRGIDSDFIRRVTKEYHVGCVSEVLVRYNVGHEYDRDSDWDNAGLRAAIKGTEAKFKKFPAAFELHPEMKASNLATIGVFYWVLGKRLSAVCHFAHALRIAPLSPKVYFQMARIGKFYLDASLPAVGRTIDKQLNT